MLLILAWIKDPPLQQGGHDGLQGFALQIEPPGQQHTDLPVPLAVIPRPAVDMGQQLDHHRKPHQSELGLDQLQPGVGLGIQPEIIQSLFHSKNSTS